MSRSTVGAIEVDTDVAKTAIEGSRWAEESKEPFEMLDVKNSFNTAR